LDLFILYLCDNRQYSRVFPLLYLHTGGLHSDFEKPLHEEKHLSLYGIYNIILYYIVNDIRNNSYI
jgi:hypothetical protein